MTTDMFKGLVRLTFRNPEEAAHLLLSQGWPMSARWMGLLLWRGRQRRSKPPNMHIKGALMTMLQKDIQPAS